LFVSAIAVVTVALAASPASGGRDDRSATASKRPSVSIKDNFFSPTSVSVAQGVKVTWRWRGSNDHNVKFRKVPSGASKRGAGTKSSGSFSRSFSKRGTYRYVCTIHVSSGMRGTVTVH
jgi:plastocyanin